MSGTTTTANGHAETKKPFVDRDVGDESTTDSEDSSSDDASNDGSQEDSHSMSNDNKDGDGDDDQYELRVLEVYRKLLSRRVDLVGDYAGNELFLIDGDSMLLRCFSDDKLDFDNGFQLLHAVYNVENFLHQLTKRKCNFGIVFFSSNQQLCIPPTSEPRNAAKYLLARAAIVRHLQVNLRDRQPDISVHEFQSYTSSDFDKYLQDAAPYFLMTHDGAAQGHRQGQHMAQTSEGVDSKQSRAALREMILYFIAKGYNIALINGLEWRDTKVMTMVLERKSRGELSFVRGSLALDAITDSEPEVEAKVSQVRDLRLQLTERQELAVVTVCELLQRPLGGLDDDQRIHLCSSFLLHQAVLSHLPLSARRIDPQTGSPGASDFLLAVAAMAESILKTPAWCALETTSTRVCDVYDFIDGRVYLSVSAGRVSPGSETLETYAKLVEAVKQLCDKPSDFDAPNEANQTSSTTQRSSEPTDYDLKVLPFSNSVFDKHLEPVKLQVDETAGLQQSSASHRVFREVTHWHNAKKPLIPKGPPTAASAKQEFWAAKRNQMFMAEMQKYAASLTNAVGRSLEPESVIVGATKPTSRQLTATADSVATDSDSADSSSSAKGKSQPKKGGGKKAAQSAGKQAMMNSIAAGKAKKDEAASEKIVSSWHLVCKNFEADKDTRSRYKKAKEYLTNLQSTWRDVIGAECELYMLHTLLQYWIDACRRKEKQKHVEITALIWSHARNICKASSVTKEVVSSLDLTSKALALPPISLPSADGLPQRKLPFTFALPSKVESLHVGYDSKAFQLQFCGPYLERSFDSAPDPRVDFQPDGWQRRVLDAIDRNDSVFAVAPTSAGKTFISFYAMRKVLEADDDSVLVYVAPTKALVNQIAAEIQARYSKKFKYGGKSVWAIHTRDYRINNPTGCQILVTVPHVLQIMLLAPTNANSWSSRVKRIIFDEVHSIGQAEDGVVWEQLLLLAPCPIVALSATVGNPSEFSEWLSSTQKAIGIDLVTVQHPYRYSDLRKYYYVPPERFAFDGLPAKSVFGTLGIDGANNINHIHPVAGLVDKSRGVPEDLALEPWDCLELYNAMKKHATTDYPVSDDLSPNVALPAVSRKADILKWERALKDLLKAWLADNGSPYDKIVGELEQNFRDTRRESLQATQSGAVEGTKSSKLDAEDLTKTTLPLLCRLNEQDALPAILFNYDRHMCEKICRTMLEQLQSAELSQQKSGPKWEKKLERFEEWKKIQEKNAAKKSKVASKKPNAKSKDDVDDGDKSSKLDQQRDAAGAEVSQWDNFDPDAAVDGYHFADFTRVQLSEMELYTRQLRRREVQQWLIDALHRGIGIHHAGMNRKYRQVVEILFRKGFIRVVIATGTLALGINMPCKTVVFSGDSVFLTALNYRQCAGRAGRRGFDLLGNVVFQGISREKVSRLIQSRLPDLNGHFPITTTLVLRLFTLLTESKNAKYAVSAINALLSQPRMYMGGPSFKDQTMHHLRFSIEYLRRQYLLAPNGAPLNFAGLVSHLYFTENSSFAFHALLKEGYFHELCDGIKTNEKDTLETLMLVMAHLFNRIYCRQADEEYRKKVVKPSSSIVFLPPLPNKAANILRQHNQQTLQVYFQYVASFVDQHITTEDNTLPLSGVMAGAKGDGDAGEIEALPAAHIRSAFVALSGAGDEFDSISDLCMNTRDGVFLEKAVVPHIDIAPDETDQPVNAWLLDFYKHGDVHTIERANGIRRADIWFLLNDFSMVLATVIASLLGFMKLKEGTDMDMLDVMGNMDAHEEAEDEKVAASEEQSEMSGPSVADSAIAMPERPKAVNKKKAKDMDSWEDAADDEDAIIKSEGDRASNGATSFGSDRDAAAWEGEAGGGEGLKNVLKAFTKLHAEFTIKFKAMWA